MKREKINSPNVDLTKGPIGKQLLMFALPLLGSSFIQQLYNTVDLLFVGNLVGKEASAAVGSCGLLVACIVGFFTGVSVGAGVVTAQRVGAGDKSGVRESIHTSVAFGFLCGILLLVSGMFLAPTLLRMMNVPESIMDLAVMYLRIYFLGSVSVVSFNLCAGMIRATGNSKIPMYIQAAGGIINVFVDAMFIGILKLGVRGAAIATVVSQTSAAVFALIYLMREREEYRLELKKLRIHKDCLGKILTLGIPAGIQSLVIEVSNVLIQSQINGFDVDAMAAFAVYFQLELPIYYPIAAFGQAATTFAGQNIGAGQVKRMRDGTKICILMGIGVTIITSSLITIFAPNLVWLFNKDSEVIRYGVQVMRYSFPFYSLYVIHEVLACTIRGCGKSVSPMVIIMANFVLLRTILLFGILSVFRDVRGVAIIYPITWATTSLSIALYYRYGRWMPEIREKIV